MRPCPECGGMMLYERSVKQYVCTSCGTVMNLQELLEATERIRVEREKQEKSKRWKDEYLTWWLSSKK
jgi:DNA-directed RNA polymerase subunit M/transcription elongation factor TFIIS